MILDRREIRRWMEAEGITRLKGEGAFEDLLTRFASEVALWSSRTHLVGRSKREENILVSLMDSMHLLCLAEKHGDLGGSGWRKKVADIGSGAGFPGMVWAIAEPGIDITLFERREKPRIFLERTASMLGLGGRVTVEGDAERSAHGNEFDLVISKAAGRMGIIAPVAGELLRKGGVYMTIKGEGWEGEMRDTEKSMMSFESVEPLPGDRGSMLRLRKS